MSTEGGDHETGPENVECWGARSPNSTARQHNMRQRKKARALFLEHGIILPIIVDERMQIIDSILRFEIAKELGFQELSARGAVRQTSPSISIHLTSFPTRSLKSATR